MSRWLDPLMPEQGNHVLVALVLLAASAAADRGLVRHAPASGTVSLGLRRGRPIPQRPQPRRAARRARASSRRSASARSRVWPPVVLAPMAGVTNPPFRTLCRRFGAGLYVSEMITARALVEGNRKTLLLASFGAGGDDAQPAALRRRPALRRARRCALLVGEGRVDHIDMNFGCPVRKVTSKGGGAAIPLKPRLLRNIVRAAVRDAGARAGHDQVPHRHRRATIRRTSTPAASPRRRAARRWRCTRARRRSSTTARRAGTRSRALKQAVTRDPGARQRRHLGGGGRAAHDAQHRLRRRRSSAAAAWAGRGCSATSPTCSPAASPQDPPAFGGVVDVMLEHARLLAAWLGEAPRHARLPQARRLVHEGLPRRRAAARAPDARHRRWPSCAAILAERRPPRSRSRPRPCACARGKTRRHAEGRAARGLPRRPRRRDARPASKPKPPTRAASSVQAPARGAPRARRRRRSRTSRSRRAARSSPRHRTARARPAAGRTAAHAGSRCGPARRAGRP